MDYIDKRGIDTSYERKIFEYEPKLKSEDYIKQDKNAATTAVPGSTISGYNSDLSSIADAILAVNTDTTLDAIDTAQVALDHMLSDIEGEGFANTENAVKHAKAFWEEIRKYCEENVAGKSEIEELGKIYEEIQEIEEDIANIYKQIPITYLDGTVMSDLPDDSVGALNEYLSLQDKLKGKELELEEKKVRYCGNADVNHIVCTYANETTNIAANATGAVSSEKDLLSSNFNTIISKNSKQMLEKSADYIYNGIVSDIGALNRIYNAHLNIDNVKAHLQGLKEYSSMRETVVPASKLLFREKSESGCVDMVGMIMDNIFEECKSVEDKYGEYMSAIVTLSSTENAMLSKTFCSELKQQRFKYIKDNI